jgi:hypothetical protein
VKRRRREIPAGRFNEQLYTAVSPSREKQVMFSSIMSIFHDPELKRQSFDFEWQKLPVNEGKFLKCPKIKKGDDCGCRFCFLQ